MRYEESRLKNGMLRWSPPGVLKPRSLTAIETIALDRKNALLTLKAEQREETCWLCQNRKATIWVHEVGYDFKGDKAEPVQHNAISSADYPGPVPGFCHFCLGDGPAQLAEAVYFDRPEVYWGVRPSRWFVAYTDGTRQGGDIRQIDPKPILPTFKEEYVNDNQGS